MCKRIILGGVLGGLALFIWGFLSHTVLMLGDAGLKSIDPAASDAFVIAAKGAFKESGLYFFPHFDWQAVAKMPADQKKAAEKAYEQKIQSGPSGVIVVMATKAEMMSPWQLGREYLTNLFTCLILAFLLSQLKDTTKYTCRVCFCATAGFLVGLAVNVPFWNWYDFPGTYTIAQLVDHTIGFTLAGLVLAKLIDPSKREPAPAAAPPAK